jgi:UDP-N-acetylmuramoyl-tripeptide--D-alanyl-D-alanine ligase
MKKLTVKQIAEVLEIDYQGEDAVLTGLATDSRNVQPGCLFATWKGEQMNGHQFCAAAIEAGAAALLVNEEQYFDVPQLVVKDTIAALGKIAAWWRSQFTIPVVGLTGSNGKTTTKNMMRSILEAAVGEEAVLAPQKSYNNHVGVPLTLMQLNDKHQFAVIEMGMDKFGEIEYLTNMAKPTVAAITHAGPSHLAGVGGTLAGVAKAKGEIFKGLAEEGAAILNADDQFFDYWEDLLEEQEIITFGFSEEADVTAKNLKLTTKGCEFDLCFHDKSLPIQLPLLGKHNVANALAAAALVFALEVDTDALQQGLAAVQAEPHRLELKQLPGGATLIDDCYNANPNSMRKAIDVLKQFSGKRILLLGEMRELGEKEKQFHFELGEYAKAAGIDSLLAYGDLMQEAAKGFGEGGVCFATQEELIAAAKKALREDTVFLVKGSLSTGMRRVVDGLELAA